MSSIPAFSTKSSSMPQRQVERRVLQSANALPPLMVDKATAAALCSMGTTTYDKYAKQNLLPRMNRAGRVSIYAIQQAALRLDGVRDSVIKEDPDEALAKWEAEYGDRLEGH